MIKIMMKTKMASLLYPGAMTDFAPILALYPEYVQTFWYITDEDVPAMEATCKAYGLVKTASGVADLDNECPVDVYKKDSLTVNSITRCYLNASTNLKPVLVNYLRETCTFLVDSAAYIDDDILTFMSPTKPLTLVAKHWNARELVEDLAKKKVWSQYMILTDSTRGSVAPKTVYPVDNNVTVKTYKTAKGFLNNLVED